MLPSASSARPFAAPPRHSRRISAELIDSIQAFKATGTRLRADAVTSPGVAAAKSPHAATSAAPSTVALTVAASSSALDAPLLETRRQQSARVAAEIISSERAYLKAMSTINDVFVRRLRAACSLDTPLIEADEIEVRFRICLGSVYFALEMCLSPRLRVRLADAVWRPGCDLPFGPGFLWRTRAD
jgi:hypothetical protein